MANITIVKLKVRRGSDAQRKTIVLDQGEVGYTLDTRRVFVGDGSTLGGTVVGNKGLGVFATEQGLGDVVGAQVGDIGYGNSLLYMITSTPYEWNTTGGYLSGFSYIGNRPEKSTTLAIDSDGRLGVKKSSLDAQYFKSTFFGKGLLSAVDGSVEASINSQYLELSGNGAFLGSVPKLFISPKQNSITKREIATAALSSGLEGGNNLPVRLKINHDNFSFDESTERLTIRNTGSKSVRFSSFDPNTIGDGLVLDESTKQLEALFQGTNDTLSLVNGVLSIAPGASASADGANIAPELSYLTVADGIVTGLQTSIYDTCTATGLSGNDPGNDVAIGAVLPHARAFPNAPEGYLLCDGKAYDSALPQYKDLFDVIGSNWNTAYGAADPGGTLFRVPNLTGGDVMLYGTTGASPGATTWKLSATASTASHEISAQGFNYIIRYQKSVNNLDLFNGAPNQVSEKFLGKYDQQVYNALDSAGQNLQLSSAGFVLFALSGDVRNPGSTETFDRFAIPVYNW